MLAAWCAVCVFLHRAVIAGKVFSTPSWISGPPMGENARHGGMVEGPRMSGALLQVGSGRQFPLYSSSLSSSLSVPQGENGYVWGRDGSLQRNSLGGLNHDDLLLLPATIVNRPGNDPEMIEFDRPSPAGMEKQREYDSYVPVPILTKDADPLVHIRPKEDMMHEMLEANIEQAPPLPLVRAFKMPSHIEPILAGPTVLPDIIDANGTILIRGSWVRTTTLPKTRLAIETATSSTSTSSTNHLREMLRLAVESTDGTTAASPKIYVRTSTTFTSTKILATTTMVVSDPVTHTRVTIVRPTTTITTTIASVTSTSPAKTTTSETSNSALSTKIVSPTRTANTTSTTDASFTANAGADIKLSNQTELARRDYADPHAILARIMGKALAPSRKTTSTSTQHFQVKSAVGIGDMTTTMQHAQLVLDDALDFSDTSTTVLTHDSTSVGSIENSSTPSFINESMSVGSIEMFLSRLNDDAKHAQEGQQDNARTRADVDKNVSVAQHFEVTSAVGIGDPTTTMGHAQLVFDDDFDFSDTSTTVSTHGSAFVGSIEHPSTSAFINESMSVGSIEMFLSRLNHDARHAPEGLQDTARTRTDVDKNVSIADPSTQHLEVMNAVGKGVLTTAMGHAQLVLDDASDLSDTSTTVFTHDSTSVGSIENSSTSVFINESTSVGSIEMLLSRFNDDAKHAQEALQDTARARSDVDMNVAVADPSTTVFTHESTSVGSIENSSSAFINESMSVGSIEMFFSRLQEHAKHAQEQRQDNARTSIDVDENVSVADQSLTSFVNESDHGLTSPKVNTSFNPRMFGQFFPSLREGTNAVGTTLAHSTALLQQLFASR